ncbi:781_t:CDS:2, partial [Racocetra persica]
MSTLFTPCDEEYESRLDEYEPESQLYESERTSQLDESEPTTQELNSSSNEYTYT